MLALLISASIFVQTQSTIVMEAENPATETQRNEDLTKELSHSRNQKALTTEDTKEHKGKTS
jgi:hypothetical protein